MLHTTIHTYRNAYSGLSRSTWLLSLVMLINRSGTMVIPFIGIYVTEKLGRSVGDVGIVTGLFGAGAFTGAFLGGKLTDKIGFYPVQIITLLGGGIFFMVLGQMKTFPLICTFTFIVSFINEAFRPANSTAIAFYSKPENRTRSYALNRLAINIGWAAGTGIGGFLADINFELLFWVDGFTNVFAGFLMWTLLKPVDYKPPKQAKYKEALHSPYRDKIYMWFILITMLFAACFFQFFYNIPVFFSKELHFSKSYIGIMMAANGIIIALVEMVIVYKLEGRRNSLVYIIFGVALTGLAMLLLNAPGLGASLAFTSIILITIGEIFSMPFMNSYWISRTQTFNRGQYAALYTMAWSAAQCLGPLLGAQLADYAGFSTLWWMIGGLALVASYGYWRLLKATELERRPNNH